VFVRPKASWIEGAVKKMQIEGMVTKRGFMILMLFSMLAILSGIFVIYSTAFTCWDFRNNLWGPAHLLTQRQSPYRVDMLFDLGSAVWMPMVVGLFFPLGFLSLQQASNLWFVFNLGWFLLILWISSGYRRPSVWLFTISILLGFLFPPLVTHFWSGQISILITLLFLVAATWNDEMPAILLAALMAVGLSKPQLAILVLPGFLINRIKKSGIQNTLQLVAYLIGCILILAVPLFLAYPNWFPDFVLELQQNPSWAHPSSLYFLRNAVPEIGAAIWVMLTIMVFALNIWLWTILPSRDAIYWSLALTPLVTPYIWTWDFVLILPLFIFCLFRAKTKLSLGILLGGYLICWGLITNMKLHDEVNETFFWWVPWLLIGVIITGVSANFYNDPANHTGSFG
jgi:hypothetical protein